MVKRKLFRFVLGAVGGARALRTAAMVAPDVAVKQAFVAASLDR